MNDHLFGVANPGNSTVSNFISWHRLAEMLIRAGEQDPRYQIEKFYLEQTGRGLVYTVRVSNDPTFLT